MGYKHRVWSHAESVAISLPSEEWSPVHTHAPRHALTHTLKSQGDTRYRGESFHIYKSNLITCVYAYLWVLCEDCEIPNAQVYVQAAF